MTYPPQSDTLRIGDKVRHYRFGYGRVIEIRYKTRKMLWDKITIKHGRHIEEVDSCDVFKVRRD